MRLIDGAKQSWPARQAFNLLSLALFLGAFCLVIAALLIPVDRLISGHWHYTSVNDALGVFGCSIGGLLGAAPLAPIGLITLLGSLQGTVGDEGSHKAILWKRTWL